MGSHFNFNNFGNMGDEAGTRPPVVSSPLIRQSSVYSLTFDEFQNTWGGSLGKDFGSMNMDELLKNICTAEETHAITSTTGGVAETSSGGNNLQRQGSLTLPRTLSQKTVDEVWKDFIKETSSAAKDVARPPDPPQRQRTLGEMTLEEFLLKAGVVREDANKQQMGRTNNVGFFCDLAQLNNDNSGLALGFQPQLANRDNNNNHKSSFVTNQVSNLGMNVGPPPQQLHQSRNQNQQQPPLFPKPATVGFASPMHMANGAQLASPGARSSAVGMGNTGINNNGLARRGNGLGNAGVTVATASPGNRISPSDGVSRSDADTSSVSPIPYVFSRGRKPNAALEKVVERRHRRMIKNRESAARSRARKQAYTLELEAEIAKLKEMNEELERKQDELMQMQKNQFLEKMNHPWGGKRLCLRRTLTGPW